MADFVIEAKVLIYLTELAEGLERIGYEILLLNSLTCCLLTKILF